MKIVVMTSCDTCIHWSRYDIYDAWGNWFEKKSNPDDFGKCNAAVFDFWQKSPENQLFIMDGSEYCATMTTRRDFGCVLHTTNTAEEE